MRGCVHGHARMCACVCLHWSVPRCVCVQSPGCPPGAAASMGVGIACLPGTLWRCCIMTHAISAGFGGRIHLPPGPTGPCEERVLPPSDCTSQLPASLCLLLGNGSPLDPSRRQRRHLEIVHRTCKHVCALPPVLRKGCPGPKCSSKGVTPQHRNDLRSSRCLAIACTYESWQMPDCGCDRATSSTHTRPGALAMAACSACWKAGLCC